MRIALLSLFSYTIEASVHVLHFCKCFIAYFNLSYGATSAYQIEPFLNCRNYENTNVAFFTNATPPPPPSPNLSFNSAMSRFWRRIGNLFNVVKNS